MEYSNLSTTARMQSAILYTISAAVKYLFIKYPVPGGTK